jgi:hypothetical protein
MGTEEARFFTGRSKDQEEIFGDRSFLTFLIFL